MIGEWISIKIANSKNAYIHRAFVEFCKKKVDISQNEYVFVINYMTNIRSLLGRNAEILKKGA